ncbi:MAG: hypothetical protein NUV67_00075, partial [archaeon]|nr:hypothetical protein [archaeon]
MPSSDTFLKIDSLISSAIDVPFSLQKTPRRKLAFSNVKHRGLNSKTRYLQIAFNHDLATMHRILPKIPRDPRIL